MTFETIRPFVLEVLKENEESRGNDFLLTMNVYVKMGFAKRLPLGIMIEYKQIESAPAFETITRIRREIQNNEGLFKPSEEIQEQRANQRREFVSYFTTKQASAVTAQNSHLMP